MSDGWGRGPGGDTGPRGNSRVVPCRPPARNKATGILAPQSTPSRGEHRGSGGNFDMTCLPSRFSRLQRSPDHKRLSQVWTSGITGRSEWGANSAGIILTDVAANRSPDLIFETALNVAEGSSDTTILSPKNLQTRRSTVTFQSNVKNSSNIPEQSQISVLSRIISRIRSGLRCCTSTQRSSTQRGSSDEEQTSHSIPDSTKHTQTSVARSATTGNIASNLRLRSSLRGNSLGSSLQCATHKRGDRVRASCTVLELQRERERFELSPSRYIEDVEVFHNIRRREIVAKALYRESGQLFARLGRPHDANPPPPPFMLLSGASPLPPIKRNFESDPSMSTENRCKILSKIIGLRPHLEYVPSSDENDAEWEHCNFAEDCLRAHNLYRARHLSPPLHLSKKLCTLAQGWANNLAQTGILRHKGDPKFGENIFCRNIGLAVKTRQITPDITGEEVAAYWYSNVRQYRFSLPDTALHAHAGSYSQMVWKESKKFGVGKALSRSGKLIVVAHYYPPGNISNDFRSNVLPLSTRALASEMLCQGQALLEEALVEPEVGENSIQRALMNVTAGVSGVLAAQPPNIKGINATKILAAHMLGHAATVVTTPDEKLEVVIVSRKSLKRSKSKLKQQQTSDPRSGKSTASSSPLSSLVERKKENPNLQYVEKALKDILNMQLKQESLSDSNIPLGSGGGRPPKLSETKRVKFKSEEHINIHNRNKAVQTSFSSENLSMEDGNFDFSLSRVSSPFLDSEDETLSWSEPYFSDPLSSQAKAKKNGSSKDSTPSSFDSQRRESCSLNTISCSNPRRSSTEVTTESLSHLASTSSVHSYETSINESSFPLSESNLAEAQSITPFSNNNNQHTRSDSAYIPKMCSIRRVPVSEGSCHGSLDSVGSIPPDEPVTVTNSRSCDDVRSSSINLPYNSSKPESGLMNCYALSPLHY